MNVKYLASIKQRGISSFENEYEDCELYLENIRYCEMPPYTNSFRPSSDYTVIKIRSEYYSIHNSAFEEFKSYFDVLHSDLLLKSKHIISKHNAQSGDVEYIMDNGFKITARLDVK